MDLIHVASLIEEQNRRNNRISKKQQKKIEEVSSLGIKPGHVSDETAVILLNKNVCINKSIYGRLLKHMGDEDVSSDYPLGMDVIGKVYWEGKYDNIAKL